MIDPERLPLGEYRAYLRRTLGYDPMRVTTNPHRGRDGAIIDAELRAAGFPGLKRSDPDLGRSPSEMARLAEDAARERDRGRLEALRERNAEGKQAVAEPPTEEQPRLTPKRGRRQPTVDSKPSSAVGKRGERNSDELAAFAAQHGRITAEMVAERFHVTVGAARVRLWRAEGRGKLYDVSGNRKHYSLRRED